MSKQQFFHGYSEYQLEALRIPNQVRGQCLNLYVPYWKCLLNASEFSRWTGRACIEEKTAYGKCAAIQRNRTDLGHLMKMKLKNPQKFEQLNVAPALDTQYSPSFLNYTRH